MLKRIVLTAVSLLVAGGYCSPWPWGATLAAPTSAQRVAAREGFPHKIKEHLKVECSTCHLARRGATTGADRPEAKDFPHTSCIGCHNFAAEFFKAAFGGRGRFCAICHEPRSISRANPALIPGALVHTESSDFANQFSHKAHRTPLPAGFTLRPAGGGERSGYGRQFKPGVAPLCTDCHEPLKKMAAGARNMKTEVGHSACFVCHGAAGETRRVSADRFPHAADCGVCHRPGEGASGRRGRSIFGRIRGFKHDDHYLDIRPKRRGDFPLPTERDYMCALCHKETAEAVSLASIRLPAEKFCAECHMADRPGLPDRLSDEVTGALRGER